MARQPSFVGVRIKVERAKQHICDLAPLIEGFLQSEPYGAVPEEDPNTGDLVYKVTIFAEPPPYWGALIGDAIHNLRASLDLLVCELVRAEGNTVTGQTGFLIFKNKTAFTKTFKSGTPKKVHGAPKKAVDLIKRAKPYQGGDDALWRLHRLDIADKHKLLIPVGMTHETIVATDPITGGDMALPTGIPPSERPFPLKEGTIILRVAANARAGH